jgi:hypothetical protein
MSAIEQLKQSILLYPMIPGSVKDPNWEILITKAILELADEIHPED